jgi:hypothetical protein
VSRVIKPESGARRRTKLIKQMAQALRHGAQGGADEQAQRDVFAFLSLCLKEILESVDDTVAAWEKRDYWVKADRFRLEWLWAEQAERDLASALMTDDLSACTAAAAKLAGQINGVKLPKRGAKDIPWAGAWRTWSNATLDG